MRAILFIAAFLVVCLPASAQKKRDNTPLVDVFIGTEGNGHTSPGTALPYGMVQLSPVTRLTGPAYRFTDTVIYGFTQARFITSDSTEENSLLFMPTTGEPKLNRDDNWSAYEKKEEEASPGYYKTLLKKYDIEVELTATLRAALHRYDFPKTDKANIIINLQYGGLVENSWIEVVNKSEIRGYRLSNNQHLYFHAKFSKPFKLFGVAQINVLQQNKVKAEGKDLSLFVQFDNPGELMVKMGLSHVSAEGALKNLNTEIPDFDFKDIQKAAKTAWITELAKIQVEGGGPSKAAQASPSVSGPYNRPVKAPRPVDYDLLKRTAFYTALYHTMLTPQISSDVDGQYRLNNNKTAVAKGFIYYNVQDLYDYNSPAYQILTLTDSIRALDILKSRPVPDSEQSLKMPVKTEAELDSLFNDTRQDVFDYQPYLYSFTRSPHKTQVVLNKLLNRFTTASNGLPGNDNHGQLSAWYVLNSLGIYDLQPGSQQYIIGLPQFEKTVITLPDDKKFTILNSGVSITRGNIYLQGLNLNKQGYTKLFINYTDIAKGGELEVFTGTMANKLFMQDLEKPVLK